MLLVKLQNFKNKKIKIYIDHLNLIFTVKFVIYIKLTKFYRVKNIPS